MLTIENTELLTGVRISGDYWDLDELVQAIHELIGDENRYYDYQGSRQRIVNVSNTLHSGLQGKHHVELIANGMNKAIMKEHQLIVSDKNIYYGAHILWPELLFTTLALYDFIDLYEKLVDNTGLNLAVCVVRKFQATVILCLREHLTEEHFYVFLELMQTNRPNYFRYATQYVDVLNLQYLQLPIEARKESLAAFLYKLMLPDEDYEVIRQQLLETASFTKNALHELELDLRYPDEIEW